MSAELHARLSSRLEASRTGDGFGPRAGLPPEPEPTALAAIALDDEDARAWLLDHQRSDGGFALVVGTVVNDSATGLAALALPPGDAREQALDHLASHRAPSMPYQALVPYDPDTRGWGWTPDTFGWVEPTARALAAFRALRPTETALIADGLAVLADRECADGGWNYGTRAVFGDDMPAFGQTTAAALIGVQHADPALATRGATALRRLWREERGGLTLAMAVAALRLLVDPDAGEAETALGEALDGGDLDDDPVALGWATIATGPGLDALRGSA